MGREVREDSPPCVGSSAEMTMRQILTHVQVPHVSELPLIVLTLMHRHSRAHPPRQERSYQPRSEYTLPP